MNEEMHTRYKQSRYLRSQFDQSIIAEGDPLGRTHQYSPTRTSLSVDEKVIDAEHGLSHFIMIFAIIERYTFD